MSKWYVEYKTPHLTGDQVHRSGPYGDQEAYDNHQDISTFVGVIVLEVFDVVNDCCRVPAEEVSEPTEGNYERAMKVIQ